MCLTCLYRLELRLQKNYRTVTNPPDDVQIMRSFFAEYGNRRIARKSLQDANMQIVIMVLKDGETPRGETPRRDIAARLRGDILNIPAIRGWSKSWPNTHIYPYTTVFTHD